MLSCNGDDGGDGVGDTDTTVVGTFNGLFDDVVVGFNFPFDIGIVPDDPLTEEIEGGDIYVADYGRSRIMRIDSENREPAVSEGRMVFDPDSASDGNASSARVLRSIRVVDAAERARTR